MKKHMKILCFMKFRIKLKTSRIRFNQIDWFIRIYDGTRYLKLFAQKTWSCLEKSWISFKSKKWMILYLNDSSPIEKDWLCIIVYYT